MMQFSENVDVRLNSLPGPTLVRRSFFMCLVDLSEQRSLLVQFFPYGVKSIEQISLKASGADINSVKGRFAMPEGECFFKSP